MLNWLFAPWMVKVSMSPMVSAWSAMSLKAAINFLIWSSAGGFGAGYDFAVLFENEGVSYFWAYVFEFIYDCLQCG